MAEQAYQFGEQSEPGVQMPNQFRLRCLLHISLILFVCFYRVRSRNRPLRHLDVCRINATRPTRQAESCRHQPSYKPHNYSRDAVPTIDHGPRTRKKPIRESRTSLRNRTEVPSIFVRALMYVRQRMEKRNTSPSSRTALPELPSPPPLIPILIQ